MHLFRTEALEKNKTQRTEDMQRRLHPQKKSDFAKLYNELDVWRRAEVAKIKVRPFTTAAALCFTLINVFTIDLRPLLCQVLSEQS